MYSRDISMRNKMISITALWESIIYHMLFIWHFNIVRKPRRLISRNIFHSLISWTAILREEYSNLHIWIHISVCINSSIEYFFSFFIYYLILCNTLINYYIVLFANLDSSRCTFLVKSHVSWLKYSSIAKIQWRFPFMYSMGF